MAAGSRGPSKPQACNTTPTTLVHIPRHMNYFRNKGLFTSSSPASTTKSTPLQPKLSHDLTPPSSHPEPWETVNALSTSPISLTASADVDGHDADFVSLHESSADDSHHPFRAQYQDGTPRKHIQEDSRRATYSASSDTKNRQGGRIRISHKTSGIEKGGGGGGGSKREQGSIMMMDALSLKEENDKLKTIIHNHVDQLEESDRRRSQYQGDIERLKKEMHAAQQASKEEVEKLKATLQQQTRQFESVSAERDRIRRDREAAVANFIAETDKLRSTHAKQIEESKAKSEEMDRERARTHSELQKSRRNLEKLSGELERSMAQGDALCKNLMAAKDALHVVDVENKDLRAKASQMQALQRHLEVQSGDLKAARNESSTLRKEYDQMTALLDVRTLELKGAQTFLTTADTFSGTEVLSTLQRLNAEVLQNTAFMAESMIEAYMSDKGASMTEEQIAGAKRASNVIGRTIVHFLGTKKHTEDPVLVQIAFQAYLVHVLQWITKAWMIGGNESQNRFIDGIYERVCDTGKHDSRRVHTEVDPISRGSSHLGSLAGTHTCQSSPRPR